MIRLLALFLSLLALSRSVFASTCGASSFILGTSCIQCPDNTFLAEEDKYFCDTCSYGQQPNVRNFACESCSVGTYRPHSAGPFIHGRAHIGLVSLCLAGRSECITRVDNGKYIRALPPQLGMNQTWKVTRAIDSGAGKVSFCDPMNERSCLIVLVDQPSGVSTFPMNTTTSFETNARRAAGSFSLNRGGIFQPVDANDIPIYNRKFFIRFNTTSVVSCETPAIVSGAVDGDCILRPVSALSAGVFGYKFSSFMIYPPHHTTHSDVPVTAATTATPGMGAAIVIPSNPDKKLVSLQTFFDPLYYAMAGADNMVYAQFPMFGSLASKTEFVLTAPLNGRDGFVSFQHPTDSTKYMKSAITSVSMGTTTPVAVSVGVPNNAHDASFEIVVAPANGTFNIGFIGLRQNDTYYMWMNMTTDRANPVKMRNVSSLTTLNEFEKQQVSWRLVRRVSDVSKLTVREVSGALKGRYDAAGFVGTDGDVLQNVIHSSDAGEVHVTDPIGELDPDLYECDHGHAHSIFFQDATTGQHLYVYAKNKTVAGDTYASYDAKVIANPHDPTLAGASFPGSFVFCVLPAFDTLTGAWGATITLWNDTATALYVTGSAYEFNHPVGAADKQKATFFTTPSLGAVQTSPKSFAPLCLPCEAGYEATTRGRENCTACAIGKYSSAGAAACSDCPAGRYSDETGQSECTQCAAGQYSEAGSTTCTDCPEGTYSNAGAESCTHCPQNFFQPLTGQSSCLTCLLDNGFTDDVGNVACRACDASNPPTTMLGIANCPRAVADSINNNQCVDDTAIWIAGSIAIASFVAMCYTLYKCQQMRKGDGL